MREKKGATLWLGEYSECIKIKQLDWNGKYCSLIKTANPFSLANSIQYGMCLPEKCYQADIILLVNHGIYLFQFNYLKINKTNRTRS